MYTVTSGQTFDFDQETGEELDDVALLSSLSQLTQVEGATPLLDHADDLSRYSEDDLIRNKILGGKLEDGGMINRAAQNRLLAGSARQLRREHRALKDVVEGNTAGIGQNVAGIMQGHLLQQQEINALKAEVAALKAA